MRGRRLPIIKPPLRPRQAIVLDRCTVPRTLIVSMAWLNHEIPAPSDYSCVASRHDRRGLLRAEAGPDPASLRARLRALGRVWKELSRGIAPAVAGRHRALRDLARLRAFG